MVGFGMVVPKNISTIINTLAYSSSSVTKKKGNISLTKHPEVSMGDTPR
jgi:hypothetical protein